jgi:hypothetical protein
VFETGDPLGAIRDIGKMLVPESRLVDELDMAVRSYQLVGLYRMDWCWGCDIVFLVAWLDGLGRGRRGGLCVY